MITTLEKQLAAAQKVLNDLEEGLKEDIYNAECDLEEVQELYQEASKLYETFFHNEDYCEMNDAENEMEDAEYRLEELKKIQKRHFSHN